MKNESSETAKRLAIELEQYYNEELYYCPECGEAIPFDNENYNIDTQQYFCPNCKKLVDESELQAVDLYDYLSDNVLDVEYHIDGQFNYSSVLVYIALNGHTAWIDTAKRIIEVSWGSDEGAYPISEDITDDIDSYFEELFNNGVMNNDR